MILLFSIPGGGEIIIIFCFILLVSIVPAILYLLTLQNTLLLISPENRRMPPGNVWLLLIPLFSLVYHFILVGNMADSIKGEAVSRNINIVESRPAYNVGLAMCILNCLLFIPILNVFAGIASLVCWIIYWVKIAGFKSLLVDANRLARY